jgi:RNA polymerase sigma-70 factor (ECF subfamily)
VTDLESLYRDLRPYAFAVAYRMLGSVSEAEDIAQDAFMRLQAGSLNGIRSPKAYIATITTRLALDALTSSRAQREAYVGPWLPEPLIDRGTSESPEAATEIADSLSMAFLVVLETLTPVERAVFLLRDVFSYEYGEIATIVGKSESNCRQLASRARTHIEQSRPRFKPTRQRREELTEQFFAACQHGEMTKLIDLLASDAIFYGDGGEAGAGIDHPIVGAVAIARLLLGLFRRGEQLGIRMERVDVNGQPGAMFLDRNGDLINVIGVDVADGVIGTIRSIVNPEKLRHLGRLSPIGLRSPGPSVWEE